MLYQLFPSVPGKRPILNSVFVGVSTGVLKLSGTTAPLKLGTVGRLRRLGPGGSATSGPVVVFLIVGASNLVVVPVDVVICQTRVKTTRPASMFVPVLLDAFVSALIKIVTIDVTRGVGLVGGPVLVLVNVVYLFFSNLVCLFLDISQRSVNACSALVTGVLLFDIVVLFVLANIEGGVGMCSSFIRKTGRKFAATIHVVPCLITFLMNVTMFHASKTVSFLIKNVKCTMKLYKISADFIKTLPATLVGSLDNDNTGKLVVSAVGRLKPSSFMKHVDYIMHKTSSAAFCVLTICFNDMNVAGAHGTIAYNLVTSFSNVVTTVLVDCLFFFWVVAFGCNYGLSGEERRGT